MRRASLNDVPELVTMMAEFYSDSPYVQSACNGVTCISGDYDWSERVRGQVSRQSGCTWPPASLSYIVRRQQPFAEVIAQ